MKLSRRFPSSVIVAFAINTSLVLALLSNSALAQPASDITEIVITSRLPGPPLWQVKNGDHTLWIMADLNPVPHRVRWDYNRVNRIMAEADEYLEKPLISGPLNPPIFGGREIAELQRRWQTISAAADLTKLISEDLRKRYLALAEKWGLSNQKTLAAWFQRKPWFAAYFLRNFVFSQADLVVPDDITFRVKALSRRHKVPVTRSELKYTKEDLIAWMQEVSKVPDSYGTTCLEETLTLLEEIDEVEERARDWFTGDTYIGQFPRGGDRPFPDWGGERGACSDERLAHSKWAQDKLQQVTALWFENLERALNTNEVTFAVVQLGHLLEYEEKPASSLYPQSLLSWFRGKGYEVKEPR